jgi:hypothetical protein
MIGELDRDKYQRWWKAVVTNINEVSYRVTERVKQPLHASKC